MSSIAIQPAGKPLDATVTIPGSKSLTNRALVAAALADGTSVLSNALFADDTRHMMNALRGFGFAVTEHATEGEPDANRIEVTGRGGHLPNSEADCFCGNSGTTIRFCTALAALGQGRYRLDGVPRMRQRPIEPLGDAILILGAGVEYHGDDGYPPLTVHARGLSGGTVMFDNPASSQFVSALLLAAPAAMGDVMIEIKGALVSAPYVRMTTAIMSAMGPVVIEEIQPDSARFVVAARQPYHARNLAIEPDASNASYFLAAPAVAGGRVTLSNLGTDSIQGDIRFVDLLERMGCTIERASDAITVHGPPDGMKLKALDVDLNAMPDMAQTVAVLALFADGPTRLRNVANLRVKETDRLGALAHELTSLGARVEEQPEGLTIHPPDRIEPAAINTYDDHRMAMSFALAGLGADGVVINDPECVAKTFPDFFDRWSRLTT